MSIQVKQLSKQINQRSIIKDISFTWQAGKIIGLVGRNGAGKTTLFRTMTGHYLADHGQLLIEDQDVATVPASRKQLFYLDTQNNFFSNQTLQQISDLYALGYPKFESQRLVKLVNEEKLAMTNHYRQLSKGQQMLFQILLAIASNTPYVILDEPFDGLDLFVREHITKRLINEVAERNVGLLISSHDLEELDGLCDQVLFLDDEKLIGDYDLESFRESARKVQLVFSDKQVPAVLKEKGEVVKAYGRVLEVVFEDYTPAIEEELQAAHPVMMDFEPLTITDIFRAKLGDHHSVMTTNK